MSGAIKAERGGGGGGGGLGRQQSGNEYINKSQLKEEGKEGGGGGGQNEASPVLISVPVPTTDVLTTSPDSPSPPLRRILSKNCFSRTLLASPASSPP